MSLKDNYSESPFGGMLAKQYGKGVPIFDNPTTRNRTIGHAVLMKRLGTSGHYMGLPIGRHHGYFRKTGEDRVVEILELPYEIRDAAETIRATALRELDRTTRWISRNGFGDDPYCFLGQTAMVKGELESLRDKLNTMIERLESHC